MIFDITLLVQTLLTVVTEPVPTDMFKGALPQFKKIAKVTLRV